MSRVCDHLYDNVIDTCECKFEAGDVGAPESLFPRPVEDKDFLRLFFAQIVCQRARPIWRFVVYHHDVSCWSMLLDAFDNGPEVFALVVGGQDDEATHLRPGSPSRRRNTYSLRVV